MKYEFPDWGRMTPEYAAAELPKLLEMAEKGVDAIEAEGPKTFEGLAWAMSDATRPLIAFWGMVTHETSVMNSEAWRKVEEDFQPHLVEFSLRVSQSRRLYELSKGVLAGLGSNGDATRRRILEKSIQSAEVSGVGLDGERKARFNEIQQRLAKLAMDFSNAVLDATKAFKLDKDGKTYTIDDANYPETMKHCADRDVRERLFRARTARAPENAARIDEILALRKESAALLGFPDHATLSISEKCAPSVAAVMKMIDDLDAATASFAAEEDRELREIAECPPEPWDVTFLSERLRERKYSYSEEELKRNFEIEDVVAGLFKIVRFLFNVDVRELKGDDKPSVWHPDVRFFEVVENGEPIAHFYFDPYVRNGLKRGGAWMNEFRNRCDRRGEKPLALVCTNFPEPDANGKAYLPMREVETLFHEFGHALQCMLTRIGDEEAAGVSLVEWDAVEVSSQFMENWCLDDRTGIHIPADLKKKVLDAKNFRAASICRRQLAFSKIDMLLHIDGGTGGKTPGEINAEEFRHFGVPMTGNDRSLCTFLHIFAGGYAAGYYGYKWAEVMSADCYGAFEEAGLADDKAVQRLGERYRETVLALGGSKSALEVFREFRGRDPEIDALLRQNGLA